MDNAHRGDAGRDADGVEFSGDQSHKNIRQLEKESKAAPGKKQKANKKDDSALTVLCAWIVENQIGQCVTVPELDPKFTQIKALLSIYCSYMP